MQNNVIVVDSLSHDHVNASKAENILTDVVEDVDVVQPEVDARPSAADTISIHMETAPTW